MAYLDHAASTGMLPQVKRAVVEAMDSVGNASSLHASGRKARRMVEESRESIAAAIGVRPSEIIFTSGGTESDNLGVKGLWWARNADRPRRRVIASAIEHHAVLDPVEWLAEHEGADVHWLSVDEHGSVALDELRDVLGDGSDVAFVTVMWANNEVGTLQPVNEIAQLCRDVNVPFLSDAVQALGRVHVDAAIPDAMAASAHKIGGPHGVGILTLRRELVATSLLHGGSQERFRSGTFDVPAIVGMAAAVDVSIAHQAELAERLTGLRDDLIAKVQSIAPDAILNGAPPGPARLPGNVHFSFPGCEGDALLMLLDASGVEVSTGSACTSGVPQPSHVLLAMGVPPQQARGSLRFSLGWSSTQEDVDALFAALPPVLERARRAGMVRLGAFDGIDPAKLGAAG